MRSRSLRRDLASALGSREWLEYLGWQRGLEKGQMGQRKLSHQIGDRAVFFYNGESCSSSAAGGEFRVGYIPCQASYAVVTHRKKSITRFHLVYGQTLPRKDQVKWLVQLAPPRSRGEPDFDQSPCRFRRRVP